MRERCGAWLVSSFIALSCLAACRSGQPLDMTDAGIKARIEANLQAQRDIDLRYVTLDVHSKIATVSGLVSTWKEKKRITIIVESTAGVDQVLINLAVQE